MLRYKTGLKKPARQLRKKMTDSELVLWARLRGKQLLGVQFYRQKPIDDYIVDFYSPKAKLIIEIDGSQHLEGHHAEKDKYRDERLRRLGLRIIRFNSRQVMEETEAVLEVIYQLVREEVSGEISLSEREETEESP
jgi:very-short-patch-repair endonuclease